MVELGEHTYCLCPLTIHSFHVSASLRCAYHSLHLLHHDASSCETLSIPHARLCSYFRHPLQFGRQTTWSRLSPYQITTASTSTDRRGSASWFPKAEVSMEGRKAQAPGPQIRKDSPRSPSRYTPCSAQLRTRVEGPCCLAKELFECS